MSKNWTFQLQELAIMKIWFHYSLPHLVKNQMTKYELALHDFQRPFHPSQIRTFASYQQPLIWVLQAALTQRFFFQIIDYRDNLDCRLWIIMRRIISVIYHPLKLKILHLNTKKVQDWHVMDPTTMICPHVAPKKNHVMNGKVHATAMISVWAI